jgi:hypothetical protein
LNNPSCPDNSIPLFLDKPTLIRVYVRLDSGPIAIADISGILCNQLYQDPPAECVRPVQPIEVYQTADPVKFFRSSLAATLDFIVPPEWISTAGGHSFSLVVNPKYESGLETRDWNNKLYPYLVMLPAKKMDVVFTRIKNNGYLPDINERWKIVAWLQRVLPAGDINVWELPVRLSGSLETLDLTSTSGGGCGPWSTLLDGLEWLRGDHWQTYYLMVDYRSDVPAGYTGCGRYDGANVAAGIVSTGDRVGPEIAAQELGHTLNRHHAPSGGAGNPDPSYPVPGGLIDEYGVDVSLMQLYPPGTTYDFMGYGGGEASKWISTYTYLGFAGSLSSAFSPSGRPLASLNAGGIPTGDYFVGAGSISPTKAKIDQGFFELTLSNNTTDGLPDGPFTAQLLDARGKSLYSRNFSPPEESNTLPNGSGTFRLILPWMKDARAVVFLYHGREIGRVKASPSAPVVTLVSPKGDDHWGLTGNQTVQWTASDADGGPLTYIVEYSLDGGGTWETLAANLTEQSLIVDAAEFPGGNAVKIRVIATDGFNTASADSGNFSVDGKPPEVYISSPADGTVIQKGMPLILTALGTDLQDGPLSGSAFQWSSSRDGSLGSGKLLVNRTFSVGQHTLNLTGIDAGGRTSTYSVKIIVKDTRRSIPAYVFLLLAIVLPAVVVILSLWLIIRNRKRSRKNPVRRTGKEY